MSLQREIERIVLDLYDIKDRCRYTDEQDVIDKAINILNKINIWSDLVDC